MTELYLIIISLLIAAAIITKYFYQHYYCFFKLLPMLPIILIPFYNGSDISSLFAFSIIFGLICSLVGDIFLLYPEVHFKKGVVAFLIAHIFYSISFATIANSFRYETFVLYAVFSFFMYKFLRNYTGRFKQPVIIYILVISVMGALGMNQFANGIHPSSFQLFAGSILFVISDSVLAINKFRKSFRSAEFIILLTYYSAQLLFAYSI